MRDLEQFSDSYRDSCSESSNRAGSTSGTVFFFVELALLVELYFFCRAGSASGIVFFCRAGSARTVKRICSSSRTVLVEPALLLVELSEEPAMGQFSRCHRTIPGPAFLTVHLRG